MNVYDGSHWNIYEILPYQRCFNFINSERSIGKSYTTQMYVIDKCIQKGYEFAYIIRTKTLKEKGVFEKALSKVVRREFKDYDIEFTKENCTLVEETGVEGDTTKRLLGHCVALSEENETKVLSDMFMVKYIIFDEYIIEQSSRDGYYNGWKEPDALIKIYHTIDRDEDNVICFMLGNNIKHHNPYHMHKAFKIPFTQKGKIWTSENVLFQNAIASAELKEKKAKSKFGRMIDGTDYGNYANEGEYLNDNYSLIEKIGNNARYDMTIEFNGQSFGVYTDLKIGHIYVSDKVDYNCKLSYALTLQDHKENTMLTKSRNIVQLQWLAKNYKLGNVRFTSIEIKIKTEKGIALIL